MKILFLTLAVSLTAFPGLLLPAIPQSSSPAIVQDVRPLIIAHRGGAQEFTENTIAAFNRAVKLGAEGIETDVRLTRDGEVVIYHDDKFGRVEGLPKNGDARLISDLSFAELTSKPLAPVGADKGGQRVPTLRQVLDQVNGGLLNIEIKRGARYDELVNKTIAALKNSPALNRVVLEPPDLPTATKLRQELGAQLKLHINPGYDESVPFEVSLKRVLEFKPHSISISYKKLSREYVELAHKAGVEVWAWTVNDAEVAQAVMILGADAIKTDIPTRLLELRKHRLSGRNDHEATRQ